MLRVALACTVFVLAACSGRSDEEALQNAANQSDPAAAQVLNDAAEKGMNPQEALARAGQAQVRDSAEEGPPSGSLQAKPNLPGDPNRPEGGEPPQKVQVNGQ